MAAIILDTNLLFSALLRLDTPIQKILESGVCEVYLLEYATVEIFKLKEKILRYTTLTEAEVYTLYHELLRMVMFFDEAEINRETWEAAEKLCQGVDLNDTVYVAAAMSTKGLIWTGDKKLREGLEAKGFSQFISTAELIKQLFLEGK